MHPPLTETMKRFRRSLLEEEEEEETADRRPFHSTLNHA